MKKGIKISKLINLVLVIVFIMILSSCASIHAKDQRGGMINQTKPTGDKADAISDLSMRDVISNSISTFAIDKKGHMHIITPDFKVIDSKKLAPSPNKITNGEIVNFSAISLLATKGSPFEIRMNFDSLILCYVLDDRTGKYLGNCPREQYQ